MFQVTNGGVYSRHNEGFLMNRPRGFDKNVLLITRSKAVFQFGDETYEALPHQAVLISPGTPYSYFNPASIYSDDWIHFSGSTEDLALLDPAAFHKPFSVSDHNLIRDYIRQLLYEKNYAHSQNCEAHIDSLFRIIVDHLMYDLHHSEDFAYSPYLHKMQDLRLSMQASPQSAGTASEAADSIGISLSYFQHLYKEFFKISYQKDLIRMRLSCSEELLRTTDLSIEAIALACGYTNPVHFHRQFLAEYGMTPGQYRG